MPIMYGMAMESMPTNKDAPISQTEGSPGVPKTPAPAPELATATPPLPGEKVKTFPAAPGVYVMKDGTGRVIYVGKAKNLRNRAGHYFSKQAAEDRRTCDLV